MAKKKKQLERKFQHSIIKELEAMLPGCIVSKNATGFRDGFPDLICLVGDRWFMLECKRSQDEAHQPNQDWWVDHLNGMSYASFIFPENRAAVMGEIASRFGEHSIDILDEEEIA